MKQLTRRQVLKLGAGALIGSALAATASRPAHAAVDLRFSPEPGATLRVLRGQAFVQSDADAWLEHTRKFTEQSGVSVTVESEPWQSVQSKSADAVRAGSGPDIIFGFYDDPHIYHRELVDLTVLATYLGEKYGGWYPVCERYGTRTGKWIALPLGAAGTSMVYRRSHVAAAGFETFPTDTAGFLALCQMLAAKGTPPGFALGHAVGDANTFAHWLLWTFGGKLVDEGGNVVINSSPTWQALEYARALYQTFPPETKTWLDADNNDAFLAGAISLTQNAVSIYHAAQNATDPAVQALAEDIEHAPIPVGPVGTPTELYLFLQAMVLGYSPYPNAAREYLRYMWEREQYESWQRAASGYISQPLRDYEQNSIWGLDPKYAVYKNCTARMLWNGFSGELGEASAQAMTQYIVVDMFAAAATGEHSPEQAAARAEERAEAIYSRYRP